MLKDIKNNTNNKIILLIADRIQHYKQQLNKYNITNYRIEVINWNDILTFLETSNDVINYTKLNNLELIILDISTITLQDTKFNKLSTAIREIKKIFSDKRIFFILSSKSMTETFLSTGICKQADDIRFQPFSIIDIIDLISINKKKERLYQLQLYDHCMHVYSSTDDKIKDAIKFLKVGIENNESTLILLDKDIDLSDFKYQMALCNIDANKLQKEGLLNIAYSEDWYLSFNQNNTNDKNRVTIDNEKTYEKFFKLANQVTNKEGKKGFRIFGMMDCFFENGLVDEIVDYDCMIPPKHNKSILSICVYSDRYIKQLSENQIRKLVLTHSKVWI